MPRLIVFFLKSYINLPLAQDYISSSSRLLEDVAELDVKVGEGLDGDGLALVHPLHALLDRALQRVHEELKPFDVSIG